MSAGLGRKLVPERHTPAAARSTDSIRTGSNTDKDTDDKSLARFQLRFQLAPHRRLERVTVEPQMRPRIGIRRDRYWLSSTSPPLMILGYNGRRESPRARSRRCPAIFYSFQARTAREIALFSCQRAKHARTAGAACFGRTSNSKEKAQGLQPLGLIVA
jgi:hypothetical protein